MTFNNVLQCLVSRITASVTADHLRDRDSAAGIVDISAKVIQC